ncbi:hypothetical protein EYR36_005703 [Pleurotus pulmonarius]|nr:hypothetical protein EYR36_005703 [Pleurotus pulmonarius]
MDATPARCSPFKASYEYQLLGSTTGIRMIPPLSETPVAASRFHGAMPDTEHGFALGEPDPPSMFPAGSNARLIQNFGLDPQHVGSVPVMPLNSNRPNSEYNIFPIEFHPWPTAIPWIAPEAGQATLNDPVARDGDYTTLRDGNMPTVVPPREVYPVTTYPAGIATELSEVTLEGFMTRGSGNSTLWNEGGPSVQPESPMSERRPFSTPALFHGPMDAVGYNYSPFLPSSNQGQMPQPAQGVNLNARVVRPKIESVSPQKPAPVVTTQASSSSSSSSSESDSEDSDAPQRVESSKQTPGKAQIKQLPLQERSPSPQPVPIPSFLPSQTEAAEAAEQEKVLKERFRRFWMSSIADGFKDDLEEIRKEPNLDKSRLALLIDSLASGAEVYSSSLKDGKDINEMEVVLDS